MSPDRICPRCARRIPAALGDCPFCFPEARSPRAEASEESEPGWLARLVSLLREVFRSDEPWQRASRPAVALWVVAYAGYLVHALLDRDGFLLLHNVNLVIHEAGHLFFGWFGETLGLWGGTLAQFLVPLLIFLTFLRRREPLGVAFAAFWFFENCLDVAIYMADARAQELPLVTVGDAEVVGHDWFLIFSRLGLLRYDTAIAAAVRVLGWIGMLAAAAWLARRRI